MDPEEKRLHRLQLLDDHIGQHLRESEAAGELRAAPSFGKLLAERDGWEQTPDELRQGMKILKDAGVVPPEVEVHVADVARDECHAAALAEHDAPTEGLTGTVLLVDDERRARFALGFLLKNRGFTVREAANGLEALEAVAAGVVDVVVMDLSMPRMGGREAFLQMRSRWPTLPVILTSGYGAAQLESLPFRDDLFAFLEKPFREEALVPLLFRALRRRGECRRRRSPARRAERAKAPVRAGVQG